MSEGRPVQDGPGHAGERHFTARMNTFLVRDKSQMRANLNSKREQVLDARARGRFEGSAPDPRPGVRDGHIPGSVNLPFTDLLDPETQTMLPAEALAERFGAAGVDLSRPVVTTCGSGITAGVLALGLYIAGQHEAAVYDGSWAEWGGPDSDTPVETG